MSGQRHAPAALPPGKTRYPLFHGYRAFPVVSRPQRRSIQARKISLPPGFDPRTVHPVASPCTNCAISVPTVVRSQSKIEANKLEDFSARIVFLCTELDIVHILVFAFFENGRHQKYPVYFDLQLILWSIKLTLWPWSWTFTV
jgi:hypothetical protein